MPFRNLEIIDNWNHRNGCERRRKVQEYAKRGHGFVPAGDVDSGSNAVAGRKSKYRVRERLLSADEVLSGDGYPHWLGLREGRQTVRTQLGCDKLVGDCNQISFRVRLNSVTENSPQREIGAESRTQPSEEVLLVYSQRGKVTNDPALDIFRQQFANRDFLGRVLIGDVELCLDGVHKGHPMEAVTAK